MGVIKTTVAGMAGLMPVGLLRQMNASNFLLPYQHTVSDDYLPHIAELYPYKSLSQFEDDVRYLSKYSNKVPLAELLQLYQHKKKLPAGSVVLSFDDGFRQVHDHIAPILRHYGLNAVFFVNPAFIDNKALFYRNSISLLLANVKKDPQLLQSIATTIQCASTISSVRQHLLEIRTADDPLLSSLLHLANVDVSAFLAIEQPYLTTQQLQALHADGSLVGAHSYHHPYYHLLSLEKQIEETVSSMQWVADRLAPSIRLFSFPHMDAPVSAAFFEKLPAGTVDIFFGTQNMKTEADNRPVLHRYNAERPFTSMAQQSAMVSLYAAFKRLTNQHLVKRNSA